MPRVGEEVDLLRERRLHHVGRAGDDRAARVVHRVGDEVGHVREDREEDVLERLLLGVLVEEQVVDVRLRDLAAGSTGSIEPYLPPSTHISSVVSSLKTTFCFGMPSASKYVRKNGAVE